MWRILFGKPKRLVETYEPILGTTLDVQFESPSQRKNRERRDLALSEIERLEAIFSVFRADSELLQFNRSEGKPFTASPELNEVLELAYEWWERTGGAFHPCAVALAQAWRAGEDGLAIAEKLLEVPYRRDGTSWIKTSELPVNLNAVAKGYIVDEAVEKAAGYGELTEAVVNIGGDLRHLGSTMRGVSVEIRDPRSDATNAEVIATVRICNAALATSGRAMRPVETPNGPVNHIFDPRTGKPVNLWAGVSVISTSARVADILATTLTVLTIEEGLNLVADMDGTEFMAVSQGGEIVESPGWRSYVR